MARDCADCRYLDIYDKQDGQCFCKELEERRFANSDYAERCRKFFKIQWGYESEARKAREEAEKYQKEHQDRTYSGCFITTAVVGMLGLPDDCKELETLRKFRREVLQPNPEHAGVLLKYDTVGPIVALGMMHDENGMQMAIDIYNIFIRGCVKYIENGEVSNAVALYSEMTEALIRQYVMRSIIPEGMEESYDQMSGGHGSISLKQANRLI